MNLNFSGANRLTDKELEALEKRISKVYKDAYKGIEESWRNYLKGYDEVINGKVVHHKGLKERYVEEYKAYQDGKYTDKQFKEWYQAQVGRGKRWKALKSDMAKKITGVNQAVADYVNAQTPGIYCLNANYSAYLIEKGTGVSFNLVNEQAVRNVMMGHNSTEFRTLTVNPQRDYAWNSEKIQNALMSGILQGDSIEKIKDKFFDVMKSNENAARRNARTAYTSAQNSGRQSTFKRAQAMGIDLQKEWISTHDGRVRDSHAELDGVRVGNDDKFPNGLLYPGDSKGHPSEVYNCRCTMRAVLPKYNGEDRTNKTTASYAAWVFEKEQKQKIQNVAGAVAQSVGGKTFDALKKQLPGDFGNAIERILNNPAVSDKKEILGKMFSLDGLKVVDTNYKKTAHFNTLDRGISFNAANDEKGNSFHNPYSVFFHEMGHNIDNVMADSFYYLTTDPKTGVKLKDIIKDDYLAFKKSMGAKSNAELIKMLNNEIEELKKTNDKPLRVWGDVSDMLEGCTNISHPLLIGHGTAYHKRPGATEKEFMAEVVSAACSNKESYECIVRIFPNAVNKLWEMIGARL